MHLYLPYSLLLRPHPATQRINGNSLRRLRDVCRQSYLLCPSHEFSPFALGLTRTVTLL